MATPKLRVHNFSVSLDGYGAGPDQGPDNPVGVDGLRLHDWILATPTFAGTYGCAGTNSAGPGYTGAADGGLDDEIVAAAEVGIGATIMGRNMFGPVRGPWRDPRSVPSEQWTGWWGDERPFHHPVFVLTHHPRESFTMAGGTTFHFVDPDGTRGGLGGILDLAFEAAGGQDVRLGGGVATIQHFLQAGKHRHRIAGGRRNGMWRPWYATLWAETAVLAADAPRAAGCRYQRARALVPAGGPERLRGAAVLADMGAAGD